MSQPSNFWQPWAVPPIQRLFPLLVVLAIVTAKFVHDYRKAFPPNYAPPHPHAIRMQQERARQFEEERALNRSRR